MEKFQDMECLVLKRVEVHVEIQDMQNFQDMENFQDIKIILVMEIILDMEAKHNTLYSTTIGRRKQIYRQVYNLYTYALH